MRTILCISMVLVLDAICAQPLRAGDLAPTSAAAVEGWNFTEESVAVGLAYSHYYNTDGLTFVEPQWVIVGGLAIGDINGDGWDDIFAVTGFTDDSGVNTNPNKLFISNMDGTFTESASAWGLSSDDRHSAGPLIADFNGDGLNDLLVGGIESHGGANGKNIKLYINQGSSFTDETNQSGLGALVSNVWNFGMSAADIDRDGDLDLFIAHWADNGKPLLFKNSGSAIFTNVTSLMSDTKPLFVFTPTFADINRDGWLDLMTTNDFFHQGTPAGSRFYLNDQAGAFVQQDNAIITDENGMGAALGDYDNDGDLDWFVSSIYDADGVEPFDGSWGFSGNRLYENNGNGTFTDVTDAAGVRMGDWGWGSCFADFNNDGNLDLFHVNGYLALQWSSDNYDETQFDADPARMFISNGDKTFTESAAALGVGDTGQGRAILCFDNDRDGDIDILINNNNGPSRYFRNNLNNGNSWIVVKLTQAAPNHLAIGAMITVEANGIAQIRQVFAGGNYASSHPTAQHFGLGSASSITRLTVKWPDGVENSWEGVDIGQYLEIVRKPEQVFDDGFEEAAPGNAITSLPR